MSRSGSTARSLPDLERVVAARVKASGLTSTGDIRTSAGRVCGRVEHGLSVFRGIRFAGAPVGKGRFRRAPEAPPWRGSHSAVAFGPAAVQERISADLPIPAAAMALQAGVGEDCLCLNIWTPATDNALRPVLVWFHGGSFVEGAASQPWYD